MTLCFCWILSCSDATLPHKHDQNDSSISPDRFNCADGGNTADEAAAAALAAAEKEENDIAELRKAENSVRVGHLAHTCFEECEVIVAEAESR